MPELFIGLVQRRFHAGELALADEDPLQLGDLHPIRSFEVDRLDVKYTMPDGQNGHPAADDLGAGLVPEGELFGDFRFFVDDGKGCVRILLTVLRIHFSNGSNTGFAP